MGRYLMTLLLTLCAALVSMTCLGDETAATYENLFQEALRSVPDVPRNKAAADLAEQLGTEAIEFLKQRAMSGADRESTRMAIATLEHLGSEGAAHALGELSKVRRPAAVPWPVAVSGLALGALNRMPSDEARAVLEDVAGSADAPNARWLALVVLQGHGDRDTLTKLREIAKAESSERHQLMLKFTMEVLQRRLDPSMTDDEMAQWKACARDFTEDVFNPDPSRSIILADIRTARRFADRRRFPFEFLRLYVEEAPTPSGIAMYLMALQKEQKALPILNKYVGQRGHAGEMARMALKAFEDEDGEQERSDRRWEVDR